MTIPLVNHVYLSYSPADARWNQLFLQYLEMLDWAEPSMQVFVDSHMLGEDALSDRFVETVGRTEVAVLLISPQFLNSEFIRTRELPQLLERNRRCNMPIVPIVIEPCAWKVTDLAEFPIYPADGVPLSLMEQGQAAGEMTEIAREINSMYLRQLQVDDRIRIIVADDHEHAVRGVRDILDDDEGMQVVALCRTRQEVEHKVEELKPDIVLLDLAWYRDDNVGLELIDIIRDISPSTIVIPISNYPELIERAKKKGTFPLEKNFTYHKLIHHVRNVHQEKAKDRDGIALVAQLTSREVDVVRLIAEGYADKQIAHELNIGESTVKKHTRSIREKLNARSRVDAAVLASKAGIL